MGSSVEHVFDHVPKSTRGHFVLCFYAAVNCLINRIQLLNQIGGTSIEDTFSRYPFLGEYYSEILKHMPSNTNSLDDINWWKRAISNWENTCEIDLPIRLLESGTSLSFDNCLAFIAIGLVEEDSRFGTLFAEFQAPLNQRRPTLELIGQMVLHGRESNIDEDAWSLCRPLIELGLIEVLNVHDPRSEWFMRVPPLLWDAARGEISVQPEAWCHYYNSAQFSDISELIYPAEVISYLENVPKLITQSRVDQLIIRSDSGCDTVEVLGALAKKMNNNLIVAAVNADVKDKVSKLIAPLCLMSHSLLVLQYETSPGDTIKAPLLGAYPGPVFFILGSEGGIDSQTTGKIITLILPSPDKVLRKRFWQKAFSDIQVDDIDEITDKFHLSGGYIKELAIVAVAHAGLHGKANVQLRDVQQASRALNRQRLDMLADRLTTRGSWSELVVTASTTEKLQELERRCRYRESLNTHLGPAFSNSTNQGVRALFTGASGTGKTLAAKIIAAELGMDLYRVDLAAVVNKYIGETEKNLHHVLAEAEALDVILLLDEGDSLLGGRTDVKSANDRYANLETNFLLQRLENYQGIILITSNLVENIDRAFQRRMDIIVPFFSPQAEQRLNIMGLHLPASHQIDFDYLQQVAARCVFTGGQIRNTALHASLLAMDAGVPVAQCHLEEALKSEFRKAGAISPLETESNQALNKGGGMDVFIEALAYRQ